VLVHNAVAPYSRALRVARSLEAEGWEVLIAGTARPDLPDETLDGTIRIIRAYPAGPLARFVEPGRGRPATLVAASDAAIGAAGRLLSRIPGLGVLRAARTPTPRRVLGVLCWPLPARAWAAGLRRVLPPADLYHACGIAALVAAQTLARDARQHRSWREALLGGRRLLGRHGQRGQRGRQDQLGRHGQRGQRGRQDQRGLRGRAAQERRAGRVVYDVIDLFLEGNAYATMPRILKRLYGRRELSLVRAADGIVTVNEALAGELRRRWALAEEPAVVRNCPPWEPPPVTPPDVLRRAAGLPATTRIVLFLGIVGADRGLLESGEAVRRIPDAAFVALGFGPWYERLRARDADPRFAGRHVTLPAVHPDEVPRWAAGADAVLIAVPGDSLNQRLSTPNKFWEGLAAGVPLVVGRDLLVMRRIVEAHDLGAVADPADPDDLARALREVLDAPPDLRAARRERALALHRDLYRWEIQVRPLLALADRLVPEPRHDALDYGVRPPAGPS
jgi:glycosyltransferase involved in cell wall biosynthesis